MNCPNCGKELPKTIVGYYGSELNKLVDEECTRLMTANNIDLIQHKKSHKAVRIIESKHTTEGMKKGQHDLLKLLTSITTIGNNGESVSFEVYIVYGDYPYETADVVRFVDEKRVTVNHAGLIDFLDFESTFEDIDKSNVNKTEYLQESQPAFSVPQIDNEYWDFVFQEDK